MTIFILIWLLIGLVVSGATWYRVVITDRHDKFYTDAQYEFGYTRGQTTVLLTVVYVALAVVWPVMIMPIFRFVLKKLEEF